MESLLNFLFSHAVPISVPRPITEIWPHVNSTLPFSEMRIAYINSFNPISNMISACINSFNPFSNMSAVDNNSFNPTSNIRTAYYQLFQPHFKHINSFIFFNNISKAYVKFLSFFKHQLIQSLFLFQSLSIHSNSMRYHLSLSFFLNISTLSIPFSNISKADINSFNLFPLIQTAYTNSLYPFSSTPTLSIPFQAYQHFQSLFKHTNSFNQFSNMSKDNINSFDPFPRIQTAYINSFNPFQSFVSQIII